MRAGCNELSAPATLVSALFVVAVPMMVATVIAVIVVPSRIDEAT